MVVLTLTLTLSLTLSLTPALSLTLILTLTRCEPLRKCLKDEDPYVRKTAAVCVAKLYDINGELVEDQGFLDQVGAWRG